MKVKLKERTNIMAQIRHEITKAKAVNREIEQIELTYKEIMDLCAELRDYSFLKECAVDVLHKVERDEPVSLMLYEVQLVYKPEPVVY